MDAKLGLFVIARLRSSRLPEKMLADVAGRPALQCVLERMSLPRLPEIRVLCTTVEPEDDVLAELGRRLGWIAYRGPVDDVLARYLGAATEHGLDFFVNVDGDDLLCSWEHVDLILERFAVTGADYICCTGLPFGAAPLGVKTSALADVCRRKKETDTQGWGKYFADSGRYRVERIAATGEGAGYRMTLDYPEDLAFFRAVLGRLGSAHEELTIASIVAFLQANPEVAALSQAVSAAYYERFRTLHAGFDHSAFEA
ncbi:MAG: hypothetical protein HYV63_01325 [Candidatus Schekmanbacteria bacterium]|nr:hypothetical protein [Candidatus Schekmanbacteria bacterium]